MFFNRKSVSVYLGCDITECMQVRDALASAGIAYDCKVRNRQSQLLAPGAGTARGRFGSLGTDPGKAYEYEIKVTPDDAEAARSILSGRKKQG